MGKDIVPAGVYLIKVYNGKTRTVYEILRRSSVFIVNFEQISDVVVLDVVFIVEFEQVNVA